MKKQFFYFFNRKTFFFKSNIIILRFNPSRKLNRNEINYKEVKEIIEKFALSKLNNYSNNHIDSMSASENENSIVHPEFFDFLNNSQEEPFLDSDKKIDRRTLKFKRTQKFQEKKREFVSFGMFFF